MVQTREEEDSFEVVRIYYIKYDQISNEQIEIRTTRFFCFQSSNIRVYRFLINIYIVSGDRKYPQTRNEKPTWVDELMR